MELGVVVAAAHDAVLPPWFSFHSFVDLSNPRDVAMELRRFLLDDSGWRVGGMQHRRADDDPAAVAHALSCAGSQSVSTVTTAWLQPRTVMTATAAVWTSTWKWR
jgi:hypothetical protein